MIYVLAYPEFELGVAQCISRFRSVHEPERAKIVPPHITLVFGLNVGYRQEIISRCKRLSGLVSEFVVDFPAVEVVYDPFEKSHKLFLICATGQRTLVALHEELYEGQHHRAELNPDLPYRPHMTVATSKSVKAIQRLDIAKLGALPIQGMIRALEVVDFADGALSPLQTIPLRG
ncbi:MAG: 2'-5' RNA ligase family protein [Paracoccaceae bacterium]